MLINQLMSMMEKLAQELKEADPDKRDHFLKSTLILLDVSAEAMEKSPELRQKFAKVHSIFLKYPECRETLNQSIKAYETFVKSSLK
ncbi:MAG: hypothetical protein APF76_12725 [Desulfitibacter sp. BRH_c19]|nr:MAG: hypothetical protein APF76_12725 [Desulfitibacter sp. BRH_c19]